MSDLIERLKKEAGHLSRLALDTNNKVTKHHADLLRDAIAALSPVLSDDMVETNCPNDYPPERQFIEMTLVRMFNDRRRCWADYCDIADALSTIRMHAEDMDRERRMFNEAEGCSSEPEQG